MSAPLQVESVTELRDVVRGATRVCPVAGGTKTALTRHRDGVVRLDVSRLRGVLHYDPEELTLTARAGTPVQELAAELASHGQYLPFDPPWAAAGSTLGGVVATGASGPNAYRYGGVRDAVLAVRFVDGAARVAGGGAAVVKNAAGFDLPKLLVGSLGRLGVLTEITVKVLSAPQHTVTVAAHVASVPRALAALCVLARGPAALDAVDLDDGCRILVRLGGSAATLGARALRLRDALGLAVGDATLHHDDADARCWSGPWSKELASQYQVVRVPLTVREVDALQSFVRETAGRARYSLAANVAWLTWPSEEPLDALHERLVELGLSGIRLRGDGDADISLGRSTENAFAAAVRGALDPESRFTEA